MRTLLVSIPLTIFALASCVKASVQPDSSDSSVSSVNDTCHIEQYYHKFMARYPDGLDNDVKLKHTNEQFKKEIIDSLTKSNWLISDYPLRFESIKEYKPGLCRVHFQCWIKPAGFDFNDMNLHEFAFDLVAEVPDSYAEILKDEEYYIIHGRLNRFISHNEFTQFTNDMAYTATIGITKDVLNKDNVNISLGEMLFDVDSISPYTK